GGVRCALHRKFTLIGTSITVQQGLIKQTLETIEITHIHHTFVTKDSLPDCIMLLCYYLIVILLCFLY
ncbi:hypothetical protein L9F63_015745, partial [Diploptera punctata]